MNVILMRPLFFSCSLSFLYRARKFSFLFAFFVCAFLCFSSCSVFFFSAFSQTNAHASEISREVNTDKTEAIQQEIPNQKKRIRIGYEGNFGIFQAQAVPGKEGYGYELFQELLKYTNNSYEIEFVEVAWIEGMRMLLDGELDLLPLANYTEERAQIYGYTKVPLVHESPVLLALKDNATIGGNYQALDGAKICIHPGNVNYAELGTFLKEHNIDANIIETPYKPITQLREEGYFDYTVSSSLQLEEKLNYAFSLKSHPLYMLGNKNNQALLDDFDHAIKQLHANDFLFEKKLFVKYFYHEIPKRSFISDKEFTRLQDQEYHVGVMNLSAPVSFYNDHAGELDGLFVRTLQQFAELADIKIYTHELARDATKADIEAMDFSLIPSNFYKKYKLSTSDPFTEMPYVLIENRSKKKSRPNTPSDTPKVATFHFLHLDEALIANILDTDTVELFTYDTPYQIVEAFNNGTVNAIICTRASYNALYDTFDREILYNVTDLEYVYAPVFSFSSHFPQDKIKIFNKLITHLDHKEMENILIRTIDRMNSHSIFYYIKLYWYIYAFALFCILLASYAIYRGVKKQKEYAHKLANEINPMTGFYTFGKFLTEARELLATHSSLDARIITLDVDNFRYINEVYGFDVGTLVLKQIAHHIKQTLLTTSPVAHYGGDVFCIITPKVSYEYQALVNAFHFDSLHKAIEPILGESYDLSLSVGVYDIFDKNLDISYMIDCANIARHKSKTFFGTHIEIFNEQMKEQYTMQTETLSLIKTALLKNEFELFYQPKFDIDHMHIVGAEALIRWFRNGKMIPPDHFIPIAEENGIISELDYHVIELACQFISTHKQNCLPHISINISGLTIIKSELIDKLLELTKKYNVKPQEIDIEITETALVNNFDMAIAQILALRELGFTISMDDFGTGVSSLNRLSQMPLDTIKLDRVFIMDALANSKSSAIVQMVIDLAKNIGAKTVAEGIETQEQLELLRGLACEQGQGYFYARPMPVDKFLEYLRS